MTRRLTDIVNEGEVLGVSGGVAASVALPPDTDDRTAAQVPFTPTGSIAATNVQAALAELDTEKLSSVSVANISATGSPSASTYLRGDGTWSTPAGGSGTAIAMKKARRTAGNITLNSTAWANVDTGLDLTLTGCAIGDQIVYAVAFLVNSEATGVNFDVVTVVAGSPVNSFIHRGPAAAGGSLAGWYAPASVFTPTTGAAPPYTLVSGDIDSGSVTLRLRYRTDTAANKVMQASAGAPLDVWAQNFGPLQA